MILTALMALAAVAQDPELDCTDPQAQVEMNMCAARDFESADAELNVQWKLTVAGMKERDVDIDRSYDKRPGYYDTLLAAQRAWLTYRDQHCANEGYSMRGGSAESMVISGCKTQLTEARTAQLKTLIEEY